MNVTAIEFSRKHLTKHFKLCAWLEKSFVKKKNIICGVIYRQHNSPERFQQYFDEIIERYNASGKRICVLGDFNIDLLKTESSNYSQDFLMTLQSCYLIPTVDKPTRVRSTSATLIDNIFINFPEQVLSSGNIISDISDHFSQFCILKSAVERPNIGKGKVRDFPKFSSESFTADLSQVNWNKIVERGNGDINRLFLSFYNRLNKIINKHAPFKTPSNRRINQLTKPWITKGIRASIKVKNKLYMSGENTKYKYYRNKISTLTRIGKRQFYRYYFNDNLSNMKKTWEGINNLLNRNKKKPVRINAIKQPTGKIITNIKTRIPNIINENFTNIGPNLAKQLPTPEMPFIEFLDKNKSPTTSFFFQPITSHEIKSEILSMPSNKSFGFYSYPVSILKSASSFISNIITEIFNTSAEIGKYPTKLKMAKVIPIYKSDDETDPNNYRPISLLSCFNRKTSI